MKIPTIQLYKKKERKKKGQIDTIQFKYKIEPITCINDSHRKSHSVQSKVDD